MAVSRNELLHGMRRSLMRLAVVSLLVVPASCLNPSIVNQTTGGLYPLAPGDQPFVLALVVNDTTADIDVPIAVDLGASQPLVATFKTLSPLTRERGILLPYPFLRIALGNLSNPYDPAIIARLPSGVTIQVPFGQAPLVAGEDFQQGDTLIFRLVADARSASAISVSVGRIDGTTQTGPFSRADTFETVKLLLLRNGLSPTMISPSVTP